MEQQPHDKINYVKSHGVKIMLTHVSKMFKHRTEQVSNIYIVSICAQRSHLVQAGAIMQIS